MRISKLFGSFFLLNSIINLYAQYALLQGLNFFTKPLIIPLLAGWLLASGIMQNRRIALYTILALFGSWLGDIFLMFQYLDPIYFMLGLASFLGAHIFYIITFNILVNDGPHSKMILFRAGIIIAIIGYLKILLERIMGSLDDLKYPVIIYSIVITTMFWFALDRKGKTSRKSYYFAAFGAGFFVISDSLLALNKFDSPINQSGLLIMFTYISAQFLIAMGIISHITKSISS